MLPGLQADENKANEKLLALAQELQEKDGVKYATVIERCMNGSYLDFSSEHPTPKMLMHNDLLAVGLTDVDQRMQDGEFDT